MTQRHAKRDVLLLRTAGDRACRRPERRPWFARAERCTRPETPAQRACGSLHRCAARWTTLRITFQAPVAAAATDRHRRAQALAKLQSTRASLTDYAVELDKSADAKTGYKAKYADGKDYVLATYEKTKTQVNEYAVEPTTTYATETYAYVGDKFVETKDYTYETYDSAKTYTYDTTLSLVENAQAMAEKMMLAMGSRKEAPETVAAEDEVGGRRRLFLPCSLLINPGE